MTPLRWLALGLVATGIECLMMAGMGVWLRRRGRAPDQLGRPSVLRMRDGLVLVRNMPRGTDNGVYRRAADDRELDRDDEGRAVVPFRLR